MDEDQPDDEYEPPISDEPFTLDLPDYGQVLSFDGLVEFHEWAEQERDAWDEIDGLEKVIPIGGSHAIGTHKKFFTELAENVRIWREAPASNSDERQRAIEKVETLMRGGILPLSGRRGRRFVQLTEEEPITAVGLLLWNWTNLHSVQTGGKPQSVQPILVRAMTEARIGDLMGRGDLDAVRGLLEDLASGWARRAKAHVESVATTDHAITTTLETATARAEIHEDDMRTLRAEHAEAMARIENNYIERMKLDAPAKHWRNKTELHGKRLVGAFTAFSLAVIGGIVLLWTNGSDLLAILPKNTDGTIGLGGLVLFTVPALGFFWVLRLISRIFVTNLQQQSDADDYS